MTCVVSYINIVDLSLYKRDAGIAIILLASILFAKHLYKQL